MHMKYKRLIVLQLVLIGVREAIPLPTRKMKWQTLKGVIFR